MNPIQKLKAAGEVKVYGENSLHAGEIVLTFIGAGIMLYGSKLSPQLTQRNAILLGLAVIALGEIIF